MAVRIGTSGYNYPEWRGSFYPEKFATSKMLPYYAERFSTVEINYTFYRMPNAKTIAGWDGETPAGFCFALKAPKRITHDARLKDVDEPLRYFLDTARKLAPKLGPILFQLPPNFKQDLSRLGDLLARLPSGLRFAFEFRHASWHANDLYERLRQNNAALCIADSEKLTTPLEGGATPSSTSSTRSPASARSSRTSSARSSAQRLDRARSKPGAGARSLC